MSEVSNAKYLEHLNHNLTILSENGRIGLSKFQATNVQAITNKYVEQRLGFKNYQFLVEIPYAGGFLNWEIIFDPEDFGELPDFVFNDESFLPDPDIEFIANEIPSWDKWDLTNPQAVTNILNEFLNLYKKTEIEKLMKFSHIHKEFEDLLNKFSLSCDNIEVFIETDPVNNINNEEYNMINFLVNLPVGEDFVYLLVQIKIKLNTKEMTRKISLRSISPRVEQVLEKLRLPKLSKNDTLSTYAETVQLFIEWKMHLHHNARKLFAGQITDSFANDITEYDTTNFYKVTFMYEDKDLGDFACLVTVQLDKFPQERPRLKLNSLYCQEGESCTLSVPFDSYKPQGSEADNMNAIKAILKQQVKIFQHHKH